MTLIFIIPLLLCVVVPMLFPFFTYTTVCVLAIESVLLQQHSAINLALMEKWMNESRMNQTASDEDANLSLILNNQSIVEAMKSQELKTKAMILKTKSEEEERNAMNDNNISHSLYEIAIEEYDKATNNTANAVYEQRIYNISKAQSDKYSNRESLYEYSGEIVEQVTDFVADLCEATEILFLCKLIGATTEVSNFQI